MRQWTRTTFGWVAGLAVVASLAAIARADGVLDPTFGNGGILIKDFNNGDDFLEDAAVQDDGRIVGMTQTFLARFRADGSLDPSFGNRGIVPAFFKATWHKLAIQRDGKIVVIGDGAGFIAIARYNANGTFDTSFAGGGVTAVQFGDDAIASALGLAIRGDGKIMIESAITSLTSGQTAFVTMRVLPSGFLDPSFGDSSHGTGTRPNGTGIIRDLLSGFGFPNGLAVLPNGKTLVVGRDQDQYAIIRYNDDGSRDATFNGTGVVIGTVPSPGGPQAATAAIGQGDGGVLVTLRTSENRTTIVRYLRNGLLDLFFGIGGVKEGELGSPVATAIDLQADGRILISGAFINKFGNSGVAVSRFNTDGSDDPTFGGGGTSEIVIASAFVEPFKPTPLHVQIDGRVVVGASLGRFQPGGPPTHDWLLARYR